MPRLAVRTLVPLREMGGDHVMDGAVVREDSFTRDGEGLKFEELDVFLEGGFDDPSPGVQCGS